MPPAGGPAWATPALDRGIGCVTLDYDGLRGIEPSYLDGVVLLAIATG
jgi:hypothetical protein